MKQGYKGQKDLFALLCAALGGIVLLFIIAPLVSLFVRCSLPELARTLNDQSVRGSIYLTLWTSMAATAAFAVAAIPFAYVLARKDFPLRGLVMAVIDLPVVIPHSAAGIALLGIASRSGVLGGAAAKVGLSLVSTPAGIMLAMAFVSVPYLVNSARDGFLGVPVRLEKAALNLGASPVRVFFTVSVPMARRAILSGLVLMWARGMSEFGAVLIIAYNPKTTPVLMYERLLAYGPAYARSVAAIFIVVCLVFFVVLRVLAGTKEVAER